MAYTREKPRIARSTVELRSSIPGWGADLNPADRPSFPKEAMQDTGAHWDFPERQHRADLKHLPLDAVLWAAPYAAIGCGVYLAAKQFSSRH